jgi:hypothetical protein
VVCISAESWGDGPYLDDLVEGGDDPLKTIEIDGRS